MVAIVQTTPVVLSKLNALYPNIAYQADVSNNVDDEKRFISVYLKDRSKRDMTIM